MASRGAAEGWVTRMLCFPLVGKLAGANALIVLVALATAVAVHSPGVGDRNTLIIVALTLAASFAVSLALVTIALRPLRALEATAALVRAGDFAARVAPSPLADPDIRRVGEAFNLLLDALVADRERIRRLAAEVIRAGDAERARLARELHDSTAQTLAAVVMQLAAAAKDIQQAELAGRLESIKAAALDALEEVRLLSLTVHPRVLDDLGLPAALTHLARDAGRSSGLEIVVEAPAAAPDLQPERASVLYRVAQEAVSNALRHAAPSNVQVRLHLGDGIATVEVLDDGTGFDVVDMARKTGGLGIFSMRERTALAGGVFDLTSRLGAGTRVRASVPIASPPISSGSRMTGIA